MQLRRFALFLGIAAGAVGCSSGTTVMVPHAAGSSAPGGAHTAAPSAAPSTAPTTAMPTPVPSGALSVAAVNAALRGVETYYTTLPHINLQQDLSSLAAHMTASGAFRAAAVSPGGITATLPDGTTALVFADRDEELG